jgi:hypothetical protein
MSACIFCAEPFSPDRRCSEEHAAPNWCRSLVPDRGKARHTLIVETIDGRREVDLGLRNPFTMCVMGICEPCNTGWMHELEESCRGILSHFIQGHARNIRYWRQTQVATWAAKTAMVWESISPEDRTIPLDVLAIFHRTQRLNMRQQVWMGRYSGDDPHSFRRNAAHVVDAATARGDNPQDAHTYLVAITVGELAFVVFGHLLSTRLTFSLPQQLVSKLVPIWPPVHEVVGWPLQTTLDDAALEACVWSLGAPIS